MRKFHYWRENWGESACGVYSYGDDVYTDDKWDRITCKRCLKDRILTVKKKRLARRPQGVRP